MHPLTTILCLLSVSALAAADENERRPEDLSRFVERHCSRCHGNEDPEGKVRLDNLDPAIGDGRAARAWRRVLVVLESGDMPPENEPKPSAGNRKAVVEHLRASLSAVGGLDVRRPQYGAKGIRIPAASADEPRMSNFDQRQAARYLDDGAVAWVRSSGCIACHTSGTYMAERPGLTEALGPPKGEVHRNFEDAVYDEPAYKGDFWFVWRALGLAEWDEHVAGELSDQTAVALRTMFSRQQDDGAWDVARRRIQIPHVITRFELAVQAARAVAAAPGWLENLESEDLRRGVDRLRTFLREHRPRNDYELALVLRVDAILPGVVRPGLRERAISVLRRHQQDDGGWSTRRMSANSNWTDGRGRGIAKLLEAKPDAVEPGSDPYMTALAIVLLRESGVPTKDEQVQRGIVWLKTNQRKSGRWWMESLSFSGENRKSFTTYIATAQALRALHLCDELKLLDPQ